MTKVKTSFNRRSFIKVTASSSGGMLLGFSWMASNKLKAANILGDTSPTQFFDINAFIRISPEGLISIISPNPEIGQNVKTSMPMIIAEELDADWNDVSVEQGPLNEDVFTRQVAGGSQSIRKGWDSLRMAGATAKRMLMEAAAQKWKVDLSSLSASNGIIRNVNGEELSYGAVAEAAAQLEVPEEVELKDPKDFKIIGKSQRNVDMEGILTGAPLFGIDYRVPGTVCASVLRPPSFGMTLGSLDDSAAKKIPGVIDVITFGDKVAVLAETNWPAMKGKKALVAEWKEEGVLESSELHTLELHTALEQKAKEPRRVDGDVDSAFESADEIFEKIYEAPFLPHNCLEPMNFWANVADGKAELMGPIQTPAWTQKRVAKLLELELENVSVDMTRMGGGFGRRLYGDFALEAAEISSLSGRPVQVMFTREDDMQAGTYRPASAYRFKVGIKNGEITAWHLTEACFNGEMFEPMESNFPAGAIENYRVDCHVLDTNISTGAWRAPYANFLAFAEQAFIDELAMKLDQDPVDFRLSLFEKARTNPVGAEHNYDIDKFVGVIELAREKSGYGKDPKKHQGFCAYYSHNTYVAEVADVEMVDNSPVVKKVYCTVDCGIVVNPDAALNQVEGGIIDGIGHALYGDFVINEGKAAQNNFHSYRLIRMPEAPEVETHFVKSYNSPTGLGEPTLPPAGGAIANALFKATGKRLYKQPFVNEMEELG